MPDARRLQGSHVNAAKCPQDRQEGAVAGQVLQGGRALQQSSPQATEPKGDAHRVFFRAGITSHGCPSFAQQVNRRQQRHQIYLREASRLSARRRPDGKQVRYKGRQLVNLRIQSREM